MNQHEDESKIKLILSAKKKIMTATIGALSEFEKSFGYLWGIGKTHKTADELAFENIWLEIRSNILDNGNWQVALIEKELRNYTVDYQPDGDVFLVEDYHKNPGKKRY